MERGLKRIVTFRVSDPLIRGAGGQVKWLLSQPGGFEGLSTLREHLGSGDAAVPKRDGLPPAALHGHIASARATTLEDCDHDAVSGIEDLGCLLRVVVKGGDVRQDPVPCSLAAIGPCVGHLSSRYEHEV